MMLKAKGPVWHKKHKQKNYIPPKLRGLDKEATWSKSKACGWVYGHGSFSIVTHKIPVLGCFMWMPNSAHEAKHMYQEVAHYQNKIAYLAMDSKADDQTLWRDMRQQYHMKLVTVCRTNMNKTASRRRMIRTMSSAKYRNIYKERSYTVEPMQGLVKDIFELDRCWMRGNANNRWLFAAMGVTVQMHQRDAVRHKRSTWNIKSEVLGE